MSIFENISDPFFQNNFPNVAKRKIVKADLNSPRQELSNGGLGIVVALLVVPAMDFLGSYWASNPAVLYKCAQFLLLLPAI